MIDAVHDEIVTERNRKIRERVLRERRRAYHKRILNVKLPLEALSEDEEEFKLLESRASSVMDSGGRISAMSSASMSTLQKIDEKEPLTSQSTVSMGGLTGSQSRLPVLKLSVVKEQKWTAPLPVTGKSTKSTFSMCDPLVEATKPVSKPIKKTVKKRRKRKPSGASHVSTWITKVKD